MAGLAFDNLIERKDMSDYAELHQRFNFKVNVTKAEILRSKKIMECLPNLSLLTEDEVYDKIASNLLAGQRLKLKKSLRKFIEED